MRFLLIAAMASTAAFAADAGKDLSQAQVDEIIQKFSAKETAFAKAREMYTYRQSAKLQLLDEGGSPINEKWEEVTDVMFTGDGRRSEHVVFSPVSTLEKIQMDPGDMEDIRHTQPFVLTTSELPEYYV